MSRADGYPSRTGGEAQVLPRKDPVVHAQEGALPGPLCADELRDFDQRGYLCFDSLVEGELLDALIDESGRLFRDCQRDISPKVIHEPESEEVRSIFEVHEDYEVFRALVRHPGILAVAEQILGGPVYIHQSRINYKPAFRGEPFHWHSDFETWHVEDGMPRMRAFSLSLSLSDNRADNGPLMVMPGSHLEYVSCPGTTPEAHYERSLRRQEAGVPPEAILERMAHTHGIESPTGPSGSATIFDCNLMHGSNGNITPFSRVNLFVVFNSLQNALEDPFSGQPPRPPHIANRKPQPLP